MCKIPNNIYTHIYIGVSQKFCNIFVYVCLWWVYHGTEEVKAVVGT